MTELEQRKAELQEEMQAELAKRQADFAAEYGELCKKHKLQFMPTMILEAGKAPAVQMIPVSIEQ